MDNTKETPPTHTFLREAEEPLDSEENTQFSHYWTEPDRTAAIACAHGSGEPTYSTKPLWAINGLPFLFMLDNSAPRVAEEAFQAPVALNYWLCINKPVVHQVRNWNLKL